MSLADAIYAYEGTISHDRAHRAGSLGVEVLQAIEHFMPAEATHTAETGCGRSTILFSNLSLNHHVFCIDDRGEDHSSVAFFESCHLSRQERISTCFGPTQLTLRHAILPQTLDAVLIDGPHGYPFPEFEYMCFYPHIRAGGLLIIDDTHIPTIGRMVDVLQEDAMWETVWADLKTIIFRRTTAPATPETGDHWWTQNYNRRRTEMKPFKLKDGGKMPSTEARTAVSRALAERINQQSPLVKLLHGKPRAAWRVWRLRRQQALEAKKRRL